MIADTVGWRRSIVPPVRHGMNMKMKRFLAIFAVSLLATGCVGGVAGVEGVSVMATDKTVVDHVISLSSGKDCSSVRRELGMTYCKEDEVTPPMNVYCYHTLGEVTCYDQPIYQGKQQQVRQGGEKPR